MRLKQRRTEAEAADQRELYVCLVALDHTVDKRIYPAGSVICLDHLPPALRERLMLRGYVRPATAGDL
jgi:hypothetical protein